MFQGTGSISSSQNSSPNRGAICGRCDWMEEPGQNHTWQHRRTSGGVSFPQIFNGSLSYRTNQENSKSTSHSSLKASKSRRSLPLRAGYFVRAQFDGHPTHATCSIPRMSGWLRLRSRSTEIPWSRRSPEYCPNKSSSAWTASEFAVSRDGLRFLRAQRPIPRLDPRQTFKSDRGYVNLVHLKQHWSEELERLVPPGR